MDIVIFEPYLKQYLKNIAGTQDSMELIVGGKIEIMNLRDNYILIYNTNGISLRLRQNNHKSNMVGIFFIAKNLNGKIVGLEKEDIKKFTSKNFVFNQNLVP